MLTHTHTHTQINELIQYYAKVICHALNTTNHSLSILVLHCIGEV